MVVAFVAGVVGVLFLGVMAKSCVKQKKEPALSDKNVGQQKPKVQAISSGSPVIQEVPTQVSVKLTPSKNLASLTLGEVAYPPVGKEVGAMSVAELRGVLYRREASVATLMKALVKLEKREVIDFPAVGSEALKHSSYVFRRKVIKSLGAFGGEGAVNVLVVSLKDADPGVRQEAAKVLGVIGSPYALGFLDQRLKLEKNQRVKEAVIRSIERINGFEMQRE